MERVSLYEELRLIERNENEVSGIWKGAHLLLFFLAFVFGSFCTFCFHMLMYLFDEKCVLFPKLLSLTSLRHNVIYEFIPEEKERADLLPVDFLSTQWVEKSACYLPTYVPLVSGICGLVWTTMFLMSSSGNRSHSGLQRSWRIIPPVLIFSIAMSGLCIYSSTVTHNGLRELCVKLGEITGSSTCSYTVNVATLAYERQIRGVYQATQLTISSAWMHTCCWLASAALAIARILLAVDFRLVRVRVELVGNIDRMLERNERHLQTVMPNTWIDGVDEKTSKTSVDSMQVFFRNDQYDKIKEFGQLTKNGSDILFISEQPDHVSALSLLPEEWNKLAKTQAFKKVNKEHNFIVNIVFNLIDEVVNALSDSVTSSSSTTLDEQSKDLNKIVRQLGQQTLPTKKYSSDITENEITDSDKLMKVKRVKVQLKDDDLAVPGPSKPKRRRNSETSAISLYDSEGTETDKSIPDVEKKSNLKMSSKNVGIQTEKKIKRKHKRKFKVTIADIGKSEDDSGTLANKYSKKGNAQNEDFTKEDPKNEKPSKEELLNKVSSKKDLESKDSSKKELENKDSNKKELENKYSSKEQLLNKDSSKKEIDNVDSSKKELENKDSSKKDPENKDTSKELLNKDSSKKETENKESIKEELKNKDSSKKGPENKEESSLEDPENKDSSQKNPEKKQSSNKDPENKDSENKKSDKKDEDSQTIPKEKQD